MTTTTRDHRMMMVVVVAMTVILLFQTPTANAEKRIPTSTDAQRGNDVTTQEPLKLTKDVPRFTGPSEMDLENQTSDEKTQYFINIGIYAGAPIVLAVLVLLCYFCCYCCRVCWACCQCCRKHCGPSKWKNANHKEYTKCQRYWPMVMLIGATLASVSFASSGIAANSDFTKTLSGTESSALVNFAPQLITDTSGKLNELKGLVVDLNSKIDDAKNNASQLITDTQTTFNTGTETLKNEILLRKNQVSGLTVKAQCAGCTQRAYFSIFGYVAKNGGVFNDLENILVNQVDKPVADFNDLVNNLQTELVNKVNDVKTKLNDILKQFDDIIKDVDARKKDVDDGVSKVKEYDDLRNLVLYVLFSLVYVSGIVILVGMLCKLSIMFKANMWLNFFIAFWMWLLLAVHLPLSVLIADGCIYASKQELKELQKSNDAANIVNACLQDASLVVAFGAESHLNFTNTINFDKLNNNVANLANVTALDDLARNASSLLVTDWNVSIPLANGGLDIVDYDNKLQQINQYIHTQTACAACKTDVVNNGNWTRVAGARALYNLDTTSAPYNTDAGVQSQLNTLLANDMKGRTRDIVDVLLPTLAELKANLSNVKSTKDTLVTNLRTAEQKVANSKSFIDPFIKIGADFQKKMTCTFIGNFYLRLKTFLCRDMVKNISLIALSMFMCAFLSTFIICFSMCNHSRWAWHKGKQKAGDEFEEDEDVFAAPANPDVQPVDFRKEGRNSVELAKASNAPPSYDDARTAPSATGSSSARRPSGSSRRPSGAPTSDEGSTTGTVARSGSTSSRRGNARMKIVPK